MLTPCFSKGGENCQTRERRKFKKKKRNHVQAFLLQHSREYRIFLKVPSSTSKFECLSYSEGIFGCSGLSYTSLGFRRGISEHALCYRLCMSLPRAMLSTHLGLFNNWLEISPSDFQLNTGHRKTNSTCFSLSLVSHPNCRADQRTACGLVAEPQHIWTSSPPPSLSDRDKPILATSASSPNPQPPSETQN